MRRGFLKRFRARHAVVVQLGRFRGWLEVEDTAFFVTSYDATTGEVELSDRSCECLDAGTLSVDADEVMRCTVKGRFAARFTRAAQAHVLDALELDGDLVVLRSGSMRLRAPRLDSAS